MEYSKEFEYFWKLYPKRWNANLHTYVKRKKYPAWQSWQKLDEDTQQHILSVVKLIRVSEGGRPRDAVTWLNQRGWDDVDPPKGWQPQLPEELTKDVLKDAKGEELNMGTRRTALIRQLRKA
jgi:hypothetical protein